MNTRMASSACRARRLGLAVFAALAALAAWPVDLARAQVSPDARPFSLCVHCNGSARVAPASPGADGSRVHLTIGGHPDVQWFTLPASAYAPFVSPPVTPPPNPPILGGNHSPYSAPAVTNTPADNPSVSGVRTHANITRYWAQNAQSNPAYAIVVPPVAGGPTPLTAQVASSFPGIVAPAGFNYTWQNWVNDVNATFATFTGSRYAQITATSLGPITVDYRVSATTAPASFFSSGQFVWSAFYAAGQTGPTGNNINEIILTDQPIGGIGIASMLVDPATGIISECDLLFDATRLLQPFTSTINGPTLTTPRQWTALRHEIGHYFGLDHTNLHGGVSGLNPAGPALGNGSIATFPAANLPPAAPFSPVVAPIPGMVGAITHLGEFYNHVTSSLHFDDEVSLAKIYPVTIPGLVAGKQPLINDRARIIGRLVDRATLSNGNPVGIFGRNAWVALESYGNGAAPYPQFPLFGTLTGTSRLSVLDGAMLTSLYVRPAGHPTPAAVPVIPPATVLPAGPYYQTQTSVVGMQSAVDQCTGDISIDGLVPGTFNDSFPLAYEVVFEDAAASGSSSTNQAEWFGEASAFPPFKFYNGNAFPAAPAWAPTVFRNVLGAGLASPQFSSMRGVAGTVIALDPFEHEVQALRGPAVGTAYNVNFDFYSRPLVSITPRNGRAASTSLTINARSTTPGMLVAPATARLWVNGVEQTAALLPAPSAPGSSVTWTIPMTAVVGSTPATAPIFIQFVVRELNAGPGVAPYLAFGRNDVYL